MNPHCGKINVLLERWKIPSAHTGCCSCCSQFNGGIRRWRCLGIPRTPRPRCLRSCCCCCHGGRRLAGLALALDAARTGLGRGRSARLLLAGGGLRGVILVVQLVERMRHKQISWSVSQKGRPLQGMLALFQISKAGINLVLSARLRKAEPCEDGHKIWKPLLVSWHVRLCDGSSHFDKNKTQGCKDK